MLAGYVRSLRTSDGNIRGYMAATALLGLTVFGGMYAVLFNLYLVRLGYQASFIGLQNSIGSLSIALLSLPAGALGGRLGARRTMMLGLGITALGSAAMALTEFIMPTWQSGWLLSVNVFTGGGQALYIANSIPYLMSITRPEQRNQLFSAQSAMFPLFAFAGSLIGGLFPGVFSSLIGIGLENAAPFRYTLLVASGLLALAVPALARSNPMSTAPLDMPASTPAGADATRRGPLRIIALLSLALGLQVAGEGAARTFFNVYLDTALRVSTAEVGVLFAASQLLGAPAALMTPWLIARWGVAPTFWRTSLAMAVALVPLAFVPHWVGAGFGFMATLALGSMARPAVTLYQMESVAPAHRSAMAGATGMAVGFSYTIISLGGGALVDLFGYQTMFVISALLTVIGAVLFRSAFGHARQHA